MQFNSCLVEAIIFIEVIERYKLVYDISKIYNKKIGERICSKNMDFCLHRWGY